MWGLIIAGIGAAASLFNAVDEATSNRAIREKLDRIVEYLQALDQKLEIVLTQQKEILLRLDELPRLVRAIVQEIVDDAFLDERYASIQAIKLNITKLKLGKKYRITEPGWREFSNVLTYLFLHENRISYLFKLIFACELALVATRNQAKPFVVALLIGSDGKGGKITLLKELRDGYIGHIALEIRTLKEMLDNTEYIASHNLSEALDKLENLSFVKQPDRNRTINYSVRECKQHSGGRCGEPYETCRDVPKSREEPDTPFHSGRDNHVGAINAKVAAIAVMLKQLANLSGVIQRFEEYLTRVNSLGISGGGVLLFHEYTPVTMIAASAPLSVAARSADEDKAYRDFYDDIATEAQLIEAAETKAHRVMGEVDGIFREYPIC